MSFLAACAEQRSRELGLPWPPNISAHDRMAVPSSTDTPGATVRPSEIRHSVHEIRQLVPELAVGRPLCKQCRERPWDGRETMLCAECREALEDLMRGATDTP